MRCFPDERVSFYKNVLWCKEYLQVVYLSEIVTPDGMKIIPSTWNGERSNHFRSRWSWSRSERPSQEALKDWKKCLDVAFLLIGITRSIRHPLSKEVMQSVSWSSHCDENTQRLLVHENDVWREWRKIPRRNRNVKFERLNSVVDSGRAYQ